MQTTVIARILPLSSRDKLEVPIVGNRGERRSPRHRRFMEQHSQLPPPERAELLLGYSISHARLWTCRQLVYISSTLAMLWMKV
jgi:hypothetical protein